MSRSTPVLMVRVCSAPVLGRSGIGSRHGLDLELCHAALDGGLAIIRRHDADLTCRHPADHAAEQFCIQHDLTGFFDVGSMVVTMPISRS